MVSSGQQGNCLLRIVLRRQVPSEDMGTDLIPRREERIFVGFFIFMNMERRDFKGIIPIRADFIAGDASGINPDREDQQLEMQELLLLHTITFSHEILKWYRRSGELNTGCHSY